MLETVQSSRYGNSKLRLTAGQRVDLSLCFGHEGTFKVGLKNHE